MRPWIGWMTGAGLAAVCLMAVGCGGSDVPDPGSDDAAANEGAPPAAPQGEEPPAAVAAAPAPAAPGGPAPAAAPAPTPAASKSAGTDKPADESVAAAAPDAAPGKSEGDSTTAEMLRLATASQPPPASSAGPENGPGAGGPQAGFPGAGGGSDMAARMRQGMSSGGPGGSAGAPMMSSGGPGGSAGAPMASGGPGGSAGAPMASGGPGGSAGYPGAGGGGAESEMRARMQGQRNNGPGGVPSGYPGAGGGPGGSNGAPMAGMMGMSPGAGGGGQDNGPATTETPEGAVHAFLNAVKAKDRDRLTEATAMHAAQSGNPTESISPKNVEFFGKILDGSISDSDLDDLAKKLDGYQIGGVNAVKSTGKIGIYIQKQSEDGDLHRRTLTVRKEKKGWGVMDIGAETLFKGMGGQRRNTNRR
ncbi:hypothetical protein [Aquisphaera insulae]|uniref:hypothetical protein n=1 Tax=Aquisphaera insulae TaxID=2712864 RepID=UPI0013EC23B0|nr:hypothetical protein [Aquisphaera insulae]